jgi:hypothetical protein
VQPRSVVESYVDPRARVVESAPGSRCQALRQSADGLLIRERRRHSTQSVPSVDEDLAVTIDQHVGQRWVGQQRLQGADSTRFSAQRVDDVQDRLVAEEPAFHAESLRDVRRRGLDATIC